METKARILIIDDDDSMRAVLAEYLKIIGHDVLEAGNGRIGIDMYRREHPDLILCDVRMPEIDGMQVLQTVTKEYPEMPIIMVTGTGIIEDVINALKLGAWDYIAKPVEGIMVIKHAVAKALERARMLRENREHLEHLETVNRQLTESLRRLEEDESAARRMQFHLFPDNHQERGPYQFSRVLYPSLYLSGDFIDYFIIDGDHSGFYMVDVSGHGVSSAIVTVLLRSHINRHLRRYGHGGEDDILKPDVMLDILNRSLLNEKIGKYATIFYGVLSIKDNTLLYANGGQAPRPILRDGTQSIFIKDKNVPVGLFPYAEYRAEKISLPERFDLALFSDGILEILPQETLKEKEDFLPVLLTESADPTVEGIAEKLGLNNIVGPPDDIAILLISRRTG
ncbi:MAG: fused response regulator/phosphatase [Deltaproteobacteria bacterium HGW-Deltaproteobacteria-10]|nr:MAG: fused response regulator/phosphatase [Deltaproteobacteria bacterium HGW-Deltaproteobacteria-10]